MTVRLAVTSEPPAALVRPSKRIAWVAEALDCDDDQVRALLDSGELQGHGIGKRGVRVFVDSVTAYQERHARAAKKPAKSLDQTARRPTAASRAAHNAAIAELQRNGLA